MDNRHSFGGGSDLDSMYMESVKRQQEERLSILASQQVTGRFISDKIDFYGQHDDAGSDSFYDDPDFEQMEVLVNGLKEEIKGYKVSFNTW